MKKQRPQLLCKIDEYEYWVQFSGELDCYEVFLDKSCETYIGVCDDLHQCHIFAKYHSIEQTC